MPAAEVVPVLDVLCSKYGVLYAFENHPEKTVEEILAKVDHGRRASIGVALDTGWCGTQGMDAVDAVKRLREVLFILHLKDVTQAGSHDTCAAGEGIVPCEQIVRHLVDTGWEGTICIEHEPYDRDPMPEVLRSVKRVKEWIGG